MSEFVATLYGSVPGRHSSRCHSAFLRHFRRSTITILFNLHRLQHPRVSWFLTLRPNVPSSCSSEGPSSFLSLLWPFSLSFVYLHCRTFASASLRIDRKDSASINTHCWIVCLDDAHWDLARKKPTRIRTKTDRNTISVLDLGVLRLFGSCCFPQELCIFAWVSIKRPQRLTIQSAWYCGQGIKIT